MPTVDKETLIRNCKIIIEKGKCVDIFSEYTKTIFRVTCETCPFTYHHRENSFVDKDKKIGCVEKLGCFAENGDIKVAWFKKWLAKNTTPEQFELF